jgi:metal-dependent amidase/aminoacylase/carboxypeptidase family protein
VGRDMTPEELADKIGWSRAGVYRLLNTGQKSSGCVTLIEAELNVERGYAPTRDDNPLVKRARELAEKLSPEDVTLVIQTMERLAGKGG